MVDVPKFEVLGCWFSEQLFDKYHSLALLPKGDGGLSPLERTLAYMANELKFNLVTYLTDKNDNLPTVAKYFDKIVLGTPIALPGEPLKELPDLPALDADIYFHVDEPELAPLDMETLNAHMTHWTRQGHKPILNFCGLRRNKHDIDYAKAYLSKYRLPMTSIDIYPCYFDSTDWEFSLNYLREIRPYVQGRFVAIIQAFGKPGVWRYPTAEEIVRLAWKCKEAGVEWLQFFIWNSCWTGDELLTGFDVLPLEYHELIASMRG